MNRAFCFSRDSQHNQDCKIWYLGMRLMFVLLCRRSEQMTIEGSP